MINDADIIRVEWEAIDRAKRDEKARAHGFYNTLDESPALNAWSNDAYNAHQCVLCGQVYDTNERPAKHNRFHYSTREGGHCAYVNRSPIG